MEEKAIVVTKVRARAKGTATITPKGKVKDRKKVAGSAGVIIMLGIAQKEKVAGD